MSLQLPSRQLLRSASTLSSSVPSPANLLPILHALSLNAPSTSSTSSTSSLTRPSTTYTLSQHRNAWFGRKKQEMPEDAFTKELTGKSEARERLLQRLTKSRLESSSIFDDELAATEPDPKDSRGAGRLQQQRSGSGSPGGGGGAFTSSGASLVKEHLAMAVDPDPRSRVRWERKMVMRGVRTALNPWSREPRAARIARTERALTSSSPPLPTSVKKLVMLARQIAGKPLDDALAQMRYSKKKMAAEVRYQLAEARDLAVAERGMGLGPVNGEIFAEGSEVKIQTKDGRWVIVSDPTKIYVAEAWVGKGPWRAKILDPRARGRANIKRAPSTRIYIRLKEEKTRIREHEERAAKKEAQGPWIHLPDRPVTAQRQHYSW